MAECRKGGMRMSRRIYVFVFLFECYLEIARICCDGPQWQSASCLLRFFARPLSALLCDILRVKPGAPASHASCLLVSSTVFNCPAVQFLNVAGIGHGVTPCISRELFSRKHNRRLQQEECDVSRAGRSGERPRIFVITGMLVAIGQKAFQYGGSTVRHRGRRNTRK